MTLFSSAMPKILMMSLALICGLSFSSLALAKDTLNPKEVTTISDLLSAYHAVPSKQALVKQSEHAEAILVKLAQNKDTFPQIRHRALEALATHWKSPLAQVTYTKWLRTPSEEAQFHTAALALAKHYPKQAEPLLSPLLRVNDLQRRITVVEALKTIGTSQAREALRGAAPSESNATLRQTMLDASRVVK